MPENLPPNLPALKAGWSWVKLGDVIGNDGVFVDGDWVESKDQDPDGEVRLIQLADIGELEFRDKSNRFLTYQKALDLKCTFLKKGDLLIARMPDPLGRACIFPLNGKNKYVTVVDVAIVRVNEKKVDNKFLCYIVNAPQSRNKISALQSGSTRKRISRKNLGTIEFPLPPLAEQKKIVENIEELFSQLESGVASLKKAKEQLRLYRQSVLAFAFAGKLVQEVGSRQSAVGNSEMLKAAEPKTPYANELPDGWKWVKLGELTELITKGASPRWQGFEYVNDESQTLFVTSENVRENYLDISKPKFLNNAINDKLKRSVLKKGDVLFNLVGASIGRASVFNVDKKSNINQAVALIRLTEKLSNKYLSFYLNSESAKRHYMNEVVDFARANLSLTDTTNIPIPFCPIQEQSQIVSEIEKRFSEADNLEKAIDESLEKADRLRQSILKQAFEGKLV